MKCWKCKKETASCEFTNICNDCLDKINQLQQGWECPKCKAIMAPFQKYCIFCIGKKPWNKKDSDDSTIKPWKVTYKNKNYLHNDKWEGDE